MLSRVAAPQSSRATRSVAQNEARKRRASERRYVGSCMELCRGPARDNRTADFREVNIRYTVCNGGFNAPSNNRIAPGLLAQWSSLSFGWYVRRPDKTNAPLLR